LISTKKCIIIIKIGLKIYFEVVKMIDKRELRKIYKKKRNNITEYELKNLSNNAIANLINTPYYKNSLSVFVYINANNELITKDFIKKVWIDKKIIAVPVITKNAHEMLFVKIDSFENLSKNRFGIYEPEIKDENIIKSNENTLLIVPGLVFGKNKYRIGYGGGYYDKFISENKTLINIGICFDFQIIDFVPNDENDMELDLIISDKKII